jgi:hypothetical protein
MRPNTLVAGPQSARATVVPPEVVPPDLQLQQAPPLEKEKQRLCWDPPPLATWTEGELKILVVTLPQQTSLLATREMLRVIPRL